ncbi:MAG: hypothetical protein FJW30_08980 [Acidobacteria bacterium]|nr:hypothetical protein [Acidobacteriota bacterium]
MKTWLFTYCRAAIFGLVSSTSFAFLEVGKYPGIRSGEVAFSFPLFHGLELLSTMLFLAATPIVRGFRAGDSVLARPISLVVRVAFMVLVATGWFFLLTDQMPCFREIPNCD